MLDTAVPAKPKLPKNSRRRTFFRKGLSDNANSWVMASRELKQLPSHPRSNTLSFVLRKREVSDLYGTVRGRRLESTRSDGPIIRNGHVADPWPLKTVARVQVTGCSNNGLQRRISFNRSVEDTGLGNFD